MLIHSIHWLSRRISRVMLSASFRRPSIILKKWDVLINTAGCAITWYKYWKHLLGRVWSNQSSNCQNLLDRNWKGESWHFRSGRQSVHEMCLMQFGSETDLSSIDSVNAFNPVVILIGFGIKPKLLESYETLYQSTGKSPALPVEHQQPYNNHLNEIVFEKIKQMNTKYNVGIWKL